MAGISKKTIEEHMKLYNGYVTKYNEINEKLSTLSDNEYSKANQSYTLRNNNSTFSIFTC